MKTRHIVLLLIASIASFACQSAPARVPQQWQQLATGTKASLRGLCAIDREAAFIGGSGGTLMRTVDGGKTWADIAPPGSCACDFRDVEAFDRNQVVAMVAGQPARVYRSEDGGTNWRIVHEDPRPEAFFDAVAFAGDYGLLFGDAIGGQFCLLQTLDRGRTWRDVSGQILPAPEVGEAGFAASGTCLVAGDMGGPVFSLVTGGGPCRMILLGPSPFAAGAGGSWSRQLPMQSGASTKGAFSIAWHGDRGVVVGGDYQDPPTGTGTVAVSGNGGESWHPGDAGGFRSAVVWIDDLAVLAVGSHGSSWSGDGGRTWTAFGDLGFHSLSKGRDGSIWASGSDGRVARLCYQTERH